MTLPTMGAGPSGAGGLESGTDLVYDTFVDTNGVALVNHTPDTDLLGNGWVFDASFEINSNQAVPDGTESGEQQAYIDTTESDVGFSGIIRTKRDSGDNGIYVRYAESNDHWLVGFNTSEDKFFIEEETPGGASDRASASVSLALNTPYTVAGTAVGTTITATIDGGNEISYASASGNLTLVRHGFQGRCTTINLMYVDDFLLEVP